MNMFQRISLFWRTFTPLEDFLLNQFLRHLQTDARNTTETQINSITKTQRNLNWNEIRFYSRNINQIIKYPNTQEIVLANIEFRLKETKKKWKAKIYSVNGHLFSININPSPKKICFIKDIEIISLALIDNPMDPLANSNLVKLYSLLPEEFSKFEGQTLNNWNIKRKDAIYGIPTNVGDLFCLAQRDDEYLCLSIGGKKTKLFYIEDHESEPVLINKSFIESIKSI